MGGGGGGGIFRGWVLNRINTVMSGSHSVFVALDHATGSHIITFLLLDFPLALHQRTTISHALIDLTFS